MAQITRREGKNSISYTIRIDCGKDSEGERIRKNFGLKLPKDIGKKEEKQRLKRAVMGFEGKLKKGISTEGLTFRMLSEQWQNESQGMLSIRTIESAKYRLKEINEHIGHIDVNDLTKQDIRNYISFLEKPRCRTKKDGTSTEYYLSPISIQGHYKVISQILSYGCERDLVENNICIGKGIKKPRNENKTIKCLDRNTVQLYIEKLKEFAPLQWQTFFCLLSVTGARRGELLGLKWTDINFDKCTININETSQKVTSNGIIFKEPKTPGSSRIITIDRETVGMLQKYKIEQAKRKIKIGPLWQRNVRDMSEKYCEAHNECSKGGTGYCKKMCKNFRESNRVFVNDIGIPLSPDTPGRFMTRFCLRNNLPHTDIHTFRHTAVSQLWDQGVPVPAIAEFVGHANPRVTMEIYAHSMKETENNLSNVLAEVYKRA
jgi:integrase